MVKYIVNKNLPAVVDGSGEDVNGSWLMLLPPAEGRNVDGSWNDDWDYGKYKALLDYENNNTDKKEAWQKRFSIIVGKRWHAIASPIIVPWNTTATSESEITDAEKLNTVVSIVLKAYGDSSLTHPLENLPCGMRFRKGDFRDYGSDVSNSWLHNDFMKGDLAHDASGHIYSEFTTLGSTDNVETSKYGTKTINLKVSNIFSSVSEITSSYNTVLFRCFGTTDRGSDNYVPGTIATPLIIGTTYVHLNVGLSPKATVSGKTVARTCGGGTIEISVESLYGWIKEQGNLDNGNIKYGYESWASDNSKKVKVGSYNLEVFDEDTNTWNKVDAAYLKASNTTTKIDANGNITQANGATGTVVFQWTNTEAPNFNGEKQFRIKYNGKVGATRSGYTATLTLQVKPSYESLTTITPQIKTNYQIAPVTVNYGDDTEINILVDTPSAVDSMKGTLEYTLASDGVKHTVNMKESDKGETTITINAQGGTPVSSDDHDYETKLNLKFIPDSEYANVKTVTREATIKVKKKSVYLYHSALNMGDNNEYLNKLPNEDLMDKLKTTSFRVTDTEGVFFVIRAGGTTHTFNGHIKIEIEQEGTKYTILDKDLDSSNTGDKLVYLLPKVTKVYDALPGGTTMPFGSYRFYYTITGDGINTKTSNHGGFVFGTHVTVETRLRPSTGGTQSLYAAGSAFNLPLNQRVFTMASTTPVVRHDSYPDNPYGAVNIRGVYQYSVNNGTSWSTFKDSDGNADYVYSDFGFQTTLEISADKYGFSKGQTVRIRLRLEKAAQYYIGDDVSIDCAAVKISDV